MVRYGALAFRLTESCTLPAVRMELSKCGRTVKDHLVYGKRIANRKLSLIKHILNHSISHLVPCIKKREGSRVDLEPTPTTTQTTKEDDDDDISMPDADRNITIENVIPLKVALPERYSGNRAELETFLL
jgi:hypothetical protein